MNIKGVNMGGAPQAKMPDDSGNAQARALEQQLQQLTQEKKVAMKAQNNEKAKRLENQIQQIRKQLAQLNSKASKPERARESSQQTQVEKNPTDPSGRKLDELV